VFVLSQGGARRSGSLDGLNKGVPTPAGGFPARTVALAWTQAHATGFLKRRAADQFVPRPASFRMVFCFLTSGPNDPGPPPAVPDCGVVFQTLSAPTNCYFATSGGDARLVAKPLGRPPGPFWTISMVWAGSGAAFLPVFVEGPRFHLAAFGV